VSAVTLIGPGGAGKSTVGALVAARLGVPFVDLDRRFERRAGDISAYINRFGYEAYARTNVETYFFSLDESGDRVTALSSGFMTYSRDVHPEYSRLRQELEQSPTTFVLLPSSNREACVAETVRRQLQRRFTRTAAIEEAVIRERFPIYIALRAQRIETMGAVGAIVDELVQRVFGALSAPAGSRNGSIGIG
jgi:shikimate kinase